MLILAIPEDLHKLLQNRGSASIAPLSKLRRIVVVTIYFPFMLVVAVLCTENRGADRAGKVFNMILSFQSRNVGSTKSAAAIKAEQIKSAEVVCLAQRVLAFTGFIVNGEKLRSYYQSAVLDTIVSFGSLSIQQRGHTRHLKHSR